MKAVIAKETADALDVDIVPTKDRHRITEKGLRATARHWRGWVTFRREYALRHGGLHLAEHADWPGPGKLVQNDRVKRKNGKRIPLGTYQLQFYWDSGFYAGHEAFRDDDLADGNEAFRVAMTRSVAKLMNQTSCAQWKPPEAEQLSKWLQKAGYQPVIDQQRNVRMTLKRKGLTSQVRVTCRKGCLRFALVLGRWHKLSQPAEKAMQRLVSECNRRVRLARVSWDKDEKGAAICAVAVDLTGMPWSDELANCAGEFWLTMVGMGCHALEAALHQLGLELTVLADPANEALAKEISSVG